MDLYHYKWEMIEKEGEGDISGNAALEHSRRGPISHMMGAKVNTYVNFFGFQKRGR